MKTKPWRTVRDKKLTKAERDEVDAKVRRTMLKLDLRGIRDLLGKTQTEVAKKASMTQAEISRLERRDDYMLSTLRRVVEAMGGEVEIVASFGDKRIRLHAAR